MDQFMSLNKNKLLGFNQPNAVQVAFHLLAG